MNYFRIPFLFLVPLCVACQKSTPPKQPGSANSVSPSPSSTDTSKLSRMQNAYERGDIKTACKFKLSLSGNPLTYQGISPEILSTINDLQVKCGSNSFSIDLNN